MRIVVDEKNRILKMEGELNENFSREEFDGIINALLSCSGDRIKINLSNIPRGNSTGIYLFIKSLSALKAPILFCDTPVWLVVQFNFMNDFFLNDVLVDSIQAEYVSEETMDSKIFTVKLGKDIPVLQEYEDTDFKMKDASGKIYVADFSDDYLFFIANSYEKFKVLKELNR